MGYFYSEKGDNTSQAEGRIHDQNGTAFIILQPLLVTHGEPADGVFSHPLPCFYLIILT